MMVLYQTLTVLLMKEIHKHHRLAFQTHIRSVIGLFLGTMITLAALWFF